jgi:hypothetical protein
MGHLAPVSALERYSKRLCQVTIDLVAHDCFLDHAGRIRRSHNEALH